MEGIKPIPSHGLRGSYSRLENTLNLALNCTSAALLTTLRKRVPFVPTEGLEIIHHTT
jgi:hypothetical protein